MLKNVNLQRLGVPLLAGIAVGVGAQYVYKEYKKRSQTQDGAQVQPKPIDWARARGVALRVSSWDQYPILDRSVREAQYLSYVRQSEDVIAKYLGVSLPKPTERVVVVDRKEWLDANFASLKEMLSPIAKVFDTLAAQGKVGRLEGPIAGVQLGGMFGYLARRVLGQYELGLLSPESQEQGVLYFVEPNIDKLQRTLGLSDEFRLWIALHEVTHVFEFEAYDWVRGHFSALLNDFMTLTTQKMTEQGMGIGALLKRLADGVSLERHWLSWMMTDEERALFERLQALMSLVEGYSDHVMNVLGREMITNFDEIERKVKARKEMRSPLDELLERVMGMDLKRAQYKEGEAFVNAVVEREGLAFLQKVWEKPENLPSLAEIRQPELWVRRIRQVGG